MTPQLKHIQLAAGVMLAAFVLSGCGGSTEPKEDATLPPDCSAAIEAQYKVTGIASVTEGGKPPNFWKEFDYYNERKRVRFEWTTGVRGCTVTTTHY